MSSTVTVKVVVASFPALSVAVQVTVVAPRGNTVPEAGEQATLGLGSTLSVATGVG